jgi:transcriptional regulator with XRE-family HTH domain
MATRRKQIRPRAAGGGRPQKQTTRAGSVATLMMPRNHGSTARLVDAARLRELLGLTRREFSRLAGYSERAIAGWETGKPPGDAGRQRMVELDRLRQGLARIMKDAFISEWLLSPNAAFDGLKPIEVIERGETDRLWRMIYLGESGVPA